MVFNGTQATQLDPQELAPIYRRVRDAAHTSDPELHDWLATIQPDDWESLAWLVNHYLTPVDLYHHLHLANALAFVPQEERKFLESCAQLGAEQEQQYLTDVGRIVAALHAHGVTATLLKGAALISGGYYPRIGQRLIGDIDIAVTPDVLDTTLNALEEHGYKMSLSLPRPVESYWRTKRDLPAMWHEDGFFRLECHLRPMDKALMRSPPLDTRSLLENAQYIEIAGGRIGIPCPEHLVVHAFYHSQLYDMYELAGVDSYRSMIDVSTVVARTGKNFDWPYVNELIGSIRARKSFALFVDRIAYCVDGRALDWPVDRSGIKSKKRIYGFFSSHRKVGPLLASFVVYARAVSHALSREGRGERKILFKANPDEIQYSPVWKQLFIPSIWTKRVRLIGKRAGISN